MSKRIVRLFIKEVWRPVLGCEGFYEVSTRGRVRSLDRLVFCPRGKWWRRFPGMILKPTMRCGRNTVSLVVLGKGRYVRVYVLVLESFVGPRPKGLIACHRDDNPANDNLYNLRWGTYKSNSADTERNGHAMLGERHWGASTTSVVVRYVRRFYAKGYRICDLARKFGLKYGVTKSICYGHSWRHVA
jgi:hypothetical protein